ncbi:MAG: hypothetical protein IJP68_10120, partial [Selenomonadaceae bacterium]|nr:hypothetical protein [Selenomonadaceae bacterium]
MAKNLKMTFGYGAEQESTRNYNFSVDDSLAADCKDKIKAINTSLAAGTAGGLSTVFISDDEDFFSRITYAELSSSVT